MSIPTTKQRNAFPGDRTVVFQSPATDVDGGEWPAGTELIPAAGGYDNTTGGSYQSYTNGARFEGPRQRGRLPFPVRRVPRGGADYK